MHKRAAVTGMGIISSNGTNVSEFWSNCLDGQSVIAPIPKQWLQYSNYNSKLWSPLPEIDFSRFGFGSVEQNKLDKISLLAMDAAFQALENAGLSWRLVDEKRNTYSIPNINPDRIGVFIGTGAGGINATFNAHAYQMLARSGNELKQQIAELGAKYQIAPDDLAALHQVSAKMMIPRRFNPFTVSMLMPNAPAANIGIKFNISGPNNALCAACASGTAAIGHAFRAVQNEAVDMAIAGGAEYLYDDYGSIFQGFDILKTLVAGEADPFKANRPFDRRRSGFLFSQGGAGILIIEELERAKRRRARILAEIVSFAETSDGYNIMMPDETGRSIKLMFHQVLAQAALQPDGIDYINAHGTGTLANDLVEANILAEIFGKKPLINTTKSLIGHPIGASGAIEAIVAVLTLMNQTTHVCKNLDDPVRDLNFVREVKYHHIATALTQSFAFGGHNASLIFKKWQD
ncbi:MAG: beta-ketoacyl-[acyl-carrier-protein] synthase family protein [Firmicutes bacterium]|nr:beta-ketoacyl-[acyl-carrier-protein] synthase family protein [Bacillota bacterium]